METTEEIRNVKRGRGRPRKYPRPIGSVEKRPRGRPKGIPNKKSTPPVVDSKHGANPGTKSPYQAFIKCKYCLNLYNAEYSNHKCIVGEKNVKNAYFLHSLEHFE